MSRQEWTVPVEIESQLAQLKAQLRQLTVLRGLALATLALIGGIAVSLAVDLFWSVESGTRTMLLGAVVAGTTFVVWRTLVRPLLHCPTEAELAAMVEHAHPQLRERLSSTIELATAGGPEAGSPLMRKLLLGQTVRLANRIEFGDSLSSERTLRVVAGTAVAILAFLAPFLMSPSGYSLLMSRFFAPWGNFESAGNLILNVADGDRVVARGTDVPIEATVEWRLREGQRPDTLWLDWTNTEGETDRRRMEYDANENAYRTTIPHVFAGFDFHVSSGRDRSREYSVTVVEAPTLVKAKMHVEPPAYTGLPAADVDGLVGEINVFERSRLALDLQFNKPMQAARLEWFETDSIDPVEKPPKESPVELSEDGRSGRLELDATFSGVFAIRLTDRHGLENTDEARRVLTVQIDQPPSVAFAGGDGMTQVRPSDVVPVTVQAADDVGLDALELHYRINGRPARMLPADAAGLAEPEVSHQFTLDLAKLGVDDETVIEYRVRAADGRVVPGPQEVWTDYRRLTVSKNASDISEQAVAARQKALKEELDAIRKDLRENREAVAALEEEAEADIRMQLAFDKDEEIAPQAEAEMTIAQKVEALAARFQRQPLYAGLTEKLHEVSRDELPPTSEKLKTAADMPLMEKEGVLEESVASLEASEQKLAEVAREFEQIAQLETDLLELQRLAERVEDLAADALDLDQQRRELAANEPGPETDEQQAALDKQQQDLMQQQQDLTSDFEDLLEKRPELADAARKNELDQLKRLADLAKAIAEPQDLLAEAMQAEAQESSQNANPLAAKQEEIVRDAEELATKIAADTDRAPVKPVDLEGLRNLVEELKQGNLQEALDDQKDAAAEMDRLAAELARNDALPEDPQQAIQELSKREDALQKKIAESKKQQPAENATESEREDFDKQQRALAAEQAAIQAGLSRLTLPEDDRRRQQQVVDKAAETVEELLNNDAAQAEQRAAQTKQALDQLARQVGSDEQRRQEAARDVAQLRKTQQRLAADAERQSSENKPLEDLAKRQQDLGRQLADLPPTSQRAAQDESLARAAEAIADLETPRAADVPASQGELQKSLERLEKQLRGESTAEGQVAELQKRQENVAREAADALQNNDDARRQEQAQAQQHIVEQLEKLDAPAAEREQAAARQAARQAAQQLAGDEAAEKAPEALGEAQDALEQLAKAVTPNRKNPAEQAEQLTKRQQQAAQRAQQRAEQPGSETPEALRKAHQERADVQRGLERLRAGEAAQAEKREALEELRKATEAQQQLAKAAQENRKQPSDAAQQKVDQAKQQQARAEAAAADALARLQKRMQSPESRDESRQAQQQAAARAEQMRNETAQASAQQAADAAEAAERLADEQAELQKQTEQSGEAEKPQDAARQLAERQRSLEQQARQIPSSAAPVPLAEARRQMAAAREALQQGNAENASQAQERAEQALRDAQRQALAVAQRAAGEGERPDANEAEQLASRQRALSDELARQLEGMDPQPAEQQANANAAQAAQAMQRELAREAQELALEAARETGTESQAAQQATQLAQQAARASQQALGGQMAPAGRTAQQAAATAQQAAQQAAAATQGNPNSNLAERAEDLAARQAEAAEMLAEAAGSAETRRAAQAQGQQQLARATEQLAQGLAESARRLASEPVNLAQQGQQAAQARQAAQQGRAAQGQASQQQQQGNASNAASAARQAAQALQQAAQLASGAPPNQGMQNNPVPNDVGGQVTDAAEQLRSAQQQLAQSAPGQQGQPGSTQQGNPQQGSSQQGTAQQQSQGQPGSNQQGQSSLSQAASSLQQAAQALASAAQQLQSNPQSGMASAQNGQASQQQGQQSDSQSQATSEAGNGDGAMVTVDLQELQVELQKAGIRNWGELPGELKTEILQASRKRPRGDYAKLIQLYFEEIADAKARLDAKQKQQDKPRSGQER